MLSTQRKMIRYVYDSEADILRCTFSDKSNSYGEEDPDNIVFMRDLDSDEITGINIMDFKSMCNREDEKLLSVEQYINVKIIIKEISRL